MLYDLLTRIFHTVFADAARNQAYLPVCPVCRQAGDRHAALHSCHYKINERLPAGQPSFLQICGSVSIF